MIRVKTYIEPLQELREFQGAKEALAKGFTPIQITGCMDSQKCHVICGLSSHYRSRLVVTYSEQKAKEIYEDYKLYDAKVMHYPAKDIIFYSADIHGNAIVQERMRVLKKLLEQEAVTVIMSLDAGMDRILPLEFLESKVITISEEDSVDLEQLLQQLIQLGYERQGQVEHPGEFAVRGGILDFFPLTEDAPYRIEFFGDEIEKISEFKNSAAEKNFI